MMYQLRRASAFPNFVFALFGICLVLASGCSNQKLNNQVSQFSTTVSTGTEAIEAYYTGLNEQEKTIYLEFLEYNSEFPLGNTLELPEIGEDGKPNGKKFSIESRLATPAFSDKQIAARIAVLKVLSDYSKNLAALSGSESPTKFQNNVSTLNQRLNSLKSTFKSLSESGSEVEKTSAAKYDAPLSSIIGIVGKWYLNERRWKAIKKSVIDAEPSISVLLKNVSTDLDSYIGPIYTTGAKERYSQSVNYYNKNRSLMNLNERKQILDKIRNFKTAFDVVNSTKPSAIPNRMLKAHSALVEVARQKNPSNLSELKAEMDFLKDDVDTLVSAVNAINGGKGGTK